MQETAKPALQNLALAISLNQNGQGDRAAAAAKDAAAELYALGLKAAAMRAQLELAYALRRASLGRESLDLTEQILRSILDSGVAYAWLAGEAHLEHALGIGTLGRRAEERAELEEARTRLDRIGLRLVALRALGLITSTDNTVGNYASIWDQAGQGLTAYWNSPASDYRAQQFQYDLQTSATGLGWEQVAVVMGRAAAESARRAGNPEMEAADRTELASLLKGAQDVHEKETEITTAKNLLHALPPGPTVEDLKWSLDLERAAAEVSEGRAREVVPDLDQLLKGAGPRHPDLLMPLNEARGLALVASGNPKAASQAFQEAIAWNKQKATSFGSNSASAGS